MGTMSCQSDVLVLFSLFRRAYSEPALPLEIFFRVRSDELECSVYAGSNVGQRFPVYRIPILTYDYGDVNVNDSLR